MVTPLVHALTQFDKERIYQHYACLAPEDRYLRFGLYRDTALLRDYIDGIDFGRDLVLGVFGPNFEIAAVAHLGLINDTAELGLSVLSDYRRQQLGYRVFQTAARRAQARGFRQLWIHCLTENRAILALARKAGMRIVTNGSEADATLTLPEISPLSYGLDLYERQLALWMRAWQQLNDFQARAR